MPNKAGEYYRCKKLYGPIERGSPRFRDFVELERQNMLHSLPEDCDRSIGHHRYEHEDGFIEGALAINYFESEEDMLLYRAVYEKDNSIYRDYMKRKREQKLLDEYEYGAR